jgi:hypothetical protein
VPIVALLVGWDTGGRLAESIGAPYSLGAVVGALVGFFVARSILRWIFTRMLSEQTDETAG